MKLFLLSLLLVVQAQAAPPVREVREAFFKLLDRPQVPLDFKFTDVAGRADGVVVEQLSIASEKKADGTIERIPILLHRPQAAKGAPAVIVLHGTGGTKEGQRDWLDKLAKRGMVGVAIDARYHGGRVPGVKGAKAYNEAITRAWRAKPDEPQEHPFYYDTCWDLWRTVDYLETRAEIDPKRIGMIGFSMGGIQTWLAAAADTRIAVAVPAIGVQSFRWSLENGKWQGRAKTIKDAHEAAAKDLGEPTVNARVCRELWNKVIPGILDRFDGPSMLRLFAPRPLLILNGQQDPNCPAEGAQIAMIAAETAYKEAEAADRLKLMIHAGAHSVPGEQHEAAMEWFVRWLKP